VAADVAVGWFHCLSYPWSLFGLFVALVRVRALVVDRLIVNFWIALAAAALYVLHTVNADTVNYIIASAEIISTLGIVASFAIYFAFPNLRRYYLFVLPAAVAVLAKPPAVIFAVLFALYRALPFNERQRDHRSAAGGSAPQPDLQDYGEAGRSAAPLSWFREVAP